MIKKSCVLSLFVILLLGWAIATFAEDKPSTIEITGRAAVMALPTTV
ncbi:MAG: hypothetical protein H6Q48_2934, partial [Deltaproteobacteria bacterium]|nr:hypothetical protein [Deltaproteobacteria bacterium]